MGLVVKKAKFMGLGVHPIKDGVYVCASFDYLEEAGINIYDTITGRLFEKVIFDREVFTGKLAIAFIKDIDTCNMGYLFFNDKEEFVDPYSKAFSLDKKYSLFVKDESLKNEYKALEIPYNEAVLYLASIKGQTMCDRKIKTHRGTFEAFRKKIPYFKDLGVTSIVLMPIYEVKAPKENDFRNKKEKIKDNFWGFGEGYHYAIKTELCVSNPHKEFSLLVNDFHRNGLEIIPIMQFSENHSYEYIIAVLKYWIINFNVDGFRLIGSCLPKEAILKDPFFSNTKLLIDNFDFSSYKPEGIFKYKNVLNMNNDFQNLARRFVKSDEDVVSYLSYAVRENSKYTGSARFVTDFSGFTLYDLVSYNLKHNELNGEDNTDGTDYNYSWNCGEEGETNKRSVLNLRKRQVRNLYLLMMLCQGTPVIRGGDEFLNTQNGNNNPYCQDNETGWLTKKNDKASSDFLKFVKNLIAFRKRHCILHQPKELMLFDYMSCKVPDVSFHGEEAFKMDQTPVSREFGVLYYGDYAKQYTGKTEDSIYIIYNMLWEDREFSLPLTSDKKVWHLIYSSDGTTDESFDEDKAKNITSKSYIAKARSISILSL